MSTDLRQNVQRLWDLVRFKRHELFNEDEIISANEFAALVQDHPAVERLETNDKLRQQRDEALRVRDLAREASNRDLEAKRALEQLGIEAYLRRQWEWSKRTFGHGKRTLGIIAHIRKELLEIEAAPHDLSEWLDVAILAMDGYWRHGGKPEEFMGAMQAKQDKNFARVWPAPQSEDVAVEHDRSYDGAEPPAGGAASDSSTPESPHA